MFEKVCFIGLGLIGASLAQAMRDKKIGQINCGGQPFTINHWQRYQLRTVWCRIWWCCPGGARGDLVVIATPVQAVKKTFWKIKPFITDKTIIMDVGSTKGNIIADASAVFGEDMPQRFCAPPIRCRHQKNQGLMRVMPNHLITIKNHPNAPRYHEQNKPLKSGCAMGADWRRSGNHVRGLSW